MRDSKYDEPTESPLAFVYFPLAQRSVVPRVAVLVRSATNADVSPLQLQSLVQELDPTLPVFDAISMTRLVGDRLDRQTGIGELLSAFGLAGLLVAAIGLYGVIAYTVAERTKEIGIRLALGASPANIRKMILNGGLRLAAIGVAVGSALIVPISVFMASAVFGLQHDYALAFLGSAGVLTLVVLTATWLPSLRASRIEPTEALSSE